MKEKIKTETVYDLKSLVSTWVQEFNFLQKDVVDLVAEKENTSIMECIRAEEMTFESIAEYSELSAAQLKRKYKTIEACEDLEEYQQAKDASYERNYPMWNTLFEFKEEPSNEVKQAAIDAGIGLIEGLADFNTMLFFSGCGYSFYGTHWIPMYLNLPWNKELKKRFKNVKYDNV